MRYFFASLLLILGAGAFGLSTPESTASVSIVPLGLALSFGLIASSLPILRKAWGLKQAMIAIALFAIYTAGIIALRDEVWRHQGGSTCIDFPMP